MMPDEDEWKKLPTDQKCQHKSWKARAEGYQECIKSFPTWDEGSPDFNKYLGMIKKFVTDANELVRIQGVEAVKIFVDCANVAKKTCGEVVSGIIAKCFNTKPRLKEAAAEVCLMYIEIDKNEQTMEELIKGFSNKQPKVATACIETATTALSLFGSKVVLVKPLVKEIPALADHRDKNVREAAKSLAIEIYRWVGPAIKTSLQNLNPVMLKELEEEWDKVSASGKPVQTRFMRSQQDLREKMEAKAAAAATSGAGGRESGGQAEEEPTEVDPYDLLDPVEILSKLPKNFFEQIEAKKWQERKEMLEVCQKLCESPKIEPGDFGDLVKALKKVVCKDTNVMLVTIAAKCLAGLAKGIRKKFQPYAISCIDAVLEKFKEKKVTVVAALQEAADAIYPTTTPQALSETCLEYLESKNPSIREQTGLFLARGLSNTKSSALNKATVKPYVQSLLKNIDHSAPNVRDAAYKALGTLLKLCGDKVVMPFLVDIDNLKLEKIKEYAGKAEVSTKGGAPKPAKTEIKNPVGKADPPSQASSAKPKADAKKKTVKGGGKKADSKAPSKSAAESKPQEPVLGDGAVEEQIASFLSEEVVGQIANANWKQRLEGLQALSQKLKLTDVKSIPCQAILKTIGSGKQGWKDTNFNCLNEKFAIVKNLAENATFSKTSAEICIPGLIEKIGDVKCGKSSKEALSAVAEVTNFPWVTDMLLEIAMAHKNPKIQSESLSWLGDAVKEFGIAGLNIKLVIAKVKAAFSASNPAVRSSAFAVLGSLTLYIGSKIRMFFESEKPALLQQIDAEIEKCAGQSPPVPTRGAKAKKALESEGDEEDEAATEVNIDDLVPRVNIADKITEALIAKLSDKNWKMRKEALEEVTAILNEAKFVEPSIGDLAVAMKKRLNDSNKILIMTSLSILNQLGVALGPHCKVHVKIVAPGMVDALADSKANVRQAALNAMDQWLENTNLSIWFEDEIMSSALSVPKHTFLRIELLNWLTVKLLATPKLTSSAKEGLEACVKHLYACCEDRTGDVRAKAQGALPAFIYHLGMDKMVRMCGKLGASSISIIQGLLEKAKEHVPARKSKATQKPKAAVVPPKLDAETPSSASDKDEPKSVPSTTDASKGKSNKQSKLAKKAPSSRKQAEEPESGPSLIRINNGKEQRMKDEQKLKTLKWVFDAPRDDLVTQLKTQLTPCVSSALAAELFHADFQHHAKAIGILTQALDQLWDETVGTMDLILRWITLRFYEKNTTVHMKALEYLKNLFDKLISVDHRMTDYEAGSFVPHLITKIGEPKENIRKDVHTICQQITRLYPSSKMFNFLMQGLLTKNSRQKTECLDELGLLITTSGVNVCQPTPSKALKEIATHIGDRDNSVRSAALNVIVCAYNTCGDAVYKLVGKMNEKNTSMLEERIKRSGKYNSEPAQPPPKTESRTLKMPSARTEKPVISTSDLHSSGNMKTNDPVRIDESEYKMPELLPTDMADELLNEPDIEIPPKFITKLAEYRSRQSNAVVNVILNRITSTLANADMDESLKSAHQLDEIMKHGDKRDLLKPRIDLILTSSSIQLRMVMNRYLTDGADNGSSGDASHKVMKVESLCKCIIAINYAIWKSPDLAIQASQNPIQDYIHAVSKFMLDQRIQKLPNAKRLMALLNMLIEDLIKNANSTYVLCGMLKMLNSSLDGSDSELINLSLKCLWRVFDRIAGFISPPQGSLRPPMKPDAVLTEIHKTLESKSKRTANQEQLTTTTKTMRYLTFTICKALGIRIFDEIQNINGIRGSEILAFIIKALKADYTLAEIDAHPVRQRLLQSEIDKKENIANGDHSPEKMLSLIVKKVGDYELTKQGLQELYDFKQQYPDYDIDSKFSAMTPLFMNYIRRSLQAIDQERKNGINSSSSVLKTSDTNKRHSASEHMEHIKMLRMRCGLPVDDISMNKAESKSLSSVRSQSRNSENLGDSEPDKELHAPVAISVDLTSNNEPPPSSLPQRPATASTMESLKQRLDKIKRQHRQRN